MWQSIFDNQSINWYWSIYDRLIVTQSLSVKIDLLWVILIGIDRRWLVSIAKGWLHIHANLEQVQIGWSWKIFGVRLAIAKHQKKSRFPSCCFALWNTKPKKPCRSSALIWQHLNKQNSLLNTKPGEFSIFLPKPGDFNS